MVWAAVCGNVEAVETLLNVNDGGTSSEGETRKVAVECIKHETVDDGVTSSAKHEGGEAGATQEEGVNHQGIPQGHTKGGDEATGKEKVLQPLHAAAIVGSDKVCHVLLNSGAKVAREMED